VLAPLDDDYDALRREIWITTDEAYKRAVNVFARKKAAFQKSLDHRSAPRFSPRKRRSTRSCRSCLLRRAGETASSCAAAVSRIRCQQCHRFIGVDISAVYGSRYYMNSEGFKTITPISARVAHDVRRDASGDGNARA